MQGENLGGHARQEEAKVRAKANFEREARESTAVSQI
jgi:hypothetical protein